MNQEARDAVCRAAEILARSDALAIGAGAGMGVDSGLPDFRGREGFWRAYPPYRRLGLDFASIANPRWFRDDPALAWGFYGHRLNLYRATRPHEGFGILRRWSDRLPLGAFVFTSNVDGQFQRAGFDPSRIVEVHGAIDRMQCSSECGVGPFASEGHTVMIDIATMRAAEPLPTCPRCGSMARPSILMFGDWGWDSSETDAQMSRYRDWLESGRAGRLAVIECGAGTAIPTVRWMSETLVAANRGTLIRINPREPEVPSGHLSVPMNALEALRAIEECLTS